MIDIDRMNVKYSKVINLDIDRKVTINRINPNPFIETININVEAVKDEILIIRLSDMRGRTIKALNYPAKKGLNNIKIPDLKNMYNGTYLFEIIEDGQITNRQLIIKN